MKRPIFLGLLAAAILNVGVFSSAPARAATPDSTTAVATPAHDHGGRHHHRDRDGYESHRHHPRHDDGDDDDHGGRRRRCAGLIVICLL